MLKDWCVNLNADPVGHIMLTAAWVVLGFKFLDLIYRFWKWARR